MCLCVVMCASSHVQFSLLLCVLCVCLVIVVVIVCFCLCLRCCVAWCILFNVFCVCVCVVDAVVVLCKLHLLRVGFGVVLLLCANSCYLCCCDCVS